MRILLAISGGIAAYKTPDLVRRLRQRGGEVRCCLTAAAGQLVAPAALTAVSGHPVATSLWSDRGDMPHIDLVRWCQAVVLAPATADCMARVALGLADDLVTTLLLAVEPDRPLWFAPAMNSVMWQKPIVQQHRQSLTDAGWRQIGPASGELACGESGIGAMSDPAEIAAAVFDADDRPAC